MRYFQPFSVHLQPTNQCSTPNAWGAIVAQNWMKCLPDWLAPPYQAHVVMSTCHAILATGGIQDTLPL
jgi:hypothetical protein